MQEAEVRAWNSRDAQLDTVFDNLLYQLVIGPHPYQGEVGRSAMGNRVPKANHTIDCVFVLIDQVAFQIGSPLGIKTAQEFDVSFRQACTDQRQYPCRTQ